MSPAVAAEAVALYLDRYRGERPRIRFFGGEPLLRFPLLRRLVEEFPKTRLRPAFSFPTNGTLMDKKVVAFLKSRPDVEAAVSRVEGRRDLARLPNVLVNVSILPSAAAGLGKRVARLLARRLP